MYFNILHASKIYTRRIKKRSKEVENKKQNRHTKIANTYPLNNRA